MIDLIQGFIIAFSLILAIGAQNLFVIDQGLKKEFVLTTVLICSISDAILIVVGIMLSSYLISINPNILLLLKIIGGLWLILYGLLKIKSSNELSIEEKDNINNKNNIYNCILNTLIITYLNPHVYLDTLLLLGSISTNFDNKFLFGSGAILSSFVFFFSLGYTAKLLSKFIKNKKLWFYINNIIGILMISYGLYFIIF